MFDFNKKLEVGGRTEDADGIPIASGYLCMDILGFEHLWETMVSRADRDFACLESLLSRLNDVSPVYPTSTVGVLSYLFRIQYVKRYSSPKTTTPNEFIHQLEEFLYDDYNGHSKLLWDILKVDKYEV